MDGVVQALAELTGISAQVESATLFDRNGTVAGSTLSGERATRLASTAMALMDEAEKLNDGRELTQLEAATTAGSLFVVRDGERLIAAVTAPDPTAGLVFYDLKSCLRSAAAKPEAAAEPKPKAKPRKRAPAKAKPAKKKNGST